MLRSGDSAGDGTAYAAQGSRLLSVVKQEQERLEYVGRRSADRLWFRPQFIQHSSCTLNKTVSRTSLCENGRSSELFHRLEL